MPARRRLNERAERTRAIIGVQRAAGIAKRPRKVLPRAIPPRPIEREYARRLLVIVERARVALEPILAELPALMAGVIRERSDAVDFVIDRCPRCGVAPSGAMRINHVCVRRDAGESRRIRELLEAARARLSTSIDQDDLDELAREFARKTATYQRIQMNRQVHAALGADVFASDQFLEGLVDGFVSENVSLIKSLPTQVIGEVEKAITRAVASATPHPSLAKELQEKFNFGRDRAKLIARDQVGKFYGQVAIARQKAMGLDEFIWRTVNDRRVRPEHAQREGKRYRFSDFSAGDLPGQPILCRCYPEPVFDALLADL